MKKGWVLFAVVAAGCAEAPEGASPTVVSPPPAVVEDEGSAADGELVVLRLPGMV